MVLQRNQFRSGITRRLRTNDVTVGKIQAALVGIIMYALGYLSGIGMCPIPKTSMLSNTTPSVSTTVTRTAGVQADPATRNIKNQGPNNKRLLAAVFGDSVHDSLTRTLQDLAATRSELRKDVEQLESYMVAFANRAIQLLESTDPINVNAVFSLLSNEPEPPSISILNATYGPKIGIPNGSGVATRANVKWILQPMVYNSLLRIPKDAPLSTWFGTMPKGQEGGQPYTLDIDAMTASGHVSVSLSAPGGMLQSDLIVSSTQPTQNLEITLDELKTVMKAVANKKVGLEIGGPSRPCERTDLYRIAAKTDLVNFSEKTLWGTFQDGSIFNYTGGGQGTVRITDGLTLFGIADSSYDFVLGSHYLEHLIDPLSALLSMHRVTKPGGTIMLVLPRKEACFDHLRGQSRMEEILFRYIHKAQSDDLRYVNLNSWIFGNDLSRDRAAGSFHQLLARSIRFEDNRSIHTMVYDLKLLEQLGKLLSLEVVFKGVEGRLHQWIIFKKPTK